MGRTVYGRAVELLSQFRRESPWRRPSTWSDHVHCADEARPDRTTERANRWQSLNGPRVARRGRIFGLTRNVVSTRRVSFRPCSTTRAARRDAVSGPAVRVQLVRGEL